MLVPAAPRRATPCRIAPRRAAPGMSRYAVQALPSRRAQFRVVPCDVGRATACRVSRVSSRRATARAR
eukprot:683478-Lingulodinium_polyedra.AAC.1